MKKFNKILITLAVIAGVVLLASPAVTVFAQEKEVPAAESAAVRQPKSLEERYVDMVERYEKAGDRLDKIHELVGKVEDRIESRSADGKDTTRLQTILDTFLENLDAVEAAYAEVGALIDEHAGFNDAGEVVDEEQATLTLLDIAEGLLDVNQLGQDIKLELRRELMGYFYQNRMDN
jgi:hypothetical protein